MTVEQYFDLNFEGAVIDDCRLSMRCMPLATVCGAASKRIIDKAKAFVDECAGGIDDDDEAAVIQIAARACGIIIDG